MFYYWDSVHLEVSGDCNLLPWNCCPKFVLFVFYQFSSSSRHAASDAIVSSAGTRSSSSSASRVTSSAKSRSEIERGPNNTPFMPVPTVLSSNQSTPAVTKVGQHAPLAVVHFKWNDPILCTNYVKSVKESSGLYCV